MLLHCVFQHCLLQMSNGHNPSVIGSSSSTNGCYHSLNYFSVIIQSSKSSYCNWIFRSAQNLRNYIIPAIPKQKVFGLSKAPFCSLLRSKKSFCSCNLEGYCETEMELCFGEEAVVSDAPVAIRLIGEVQWSIVVHKDRNNRDEENVLQSVLSNLVNFNAPVLSHTKHTLCQLLRDHIDPAFSFVTCVVIWHGDKYQNVTCTFVALRNRHIWLWAEPNFCDMCKYCFSLQLEEHEIW